MKPLLSIKSTIILTLAILLAIFFSSCTSSSSYSPGQVSYYLAKQHGITTIERTLSGYKSGDTIIIYKGIVADTFVIKSVLP